MQNTRRTFNKGALAALGSLAMPAVARAADTKISFYYPVQVGGPLQPLQARLQADGWRVIAAPNGEWRGATGAMRLYQDAALLNAREVDGARERSYALDARRAAYVHVATGSATVNGVALQAGDALKIWDESMVEVKLDERAQVLLFDLPRD